MDAGARYGRYEIVRLLGEGGSGSVYEAVLHGAAGFRKRVALKVLRGESTSGGAALAKEARLGGLLQHPNLVEVYALEQIHGVWVCAMELVAGGSLRELIPLAPRAVVEVGLHVCRALQHAHDRVGLVHLDVKPDNLLVDGGTIKVADFGIAQARGFSRDGRLRGTPAYMAPELWGGLVPDVRADVFALGVTLIELASGEPSHDPDAVAWLRPVTERCLAPDRNARFPSMADLAAALATLSLEGASLAEVLGQRSPVPSWVPRSGSTSLDAWTVDPSVDDQPRTNLTAPTDRFVGREGEVEALVSRLAAPGVVVLKGAGGLGKTRLARRAAGLWHERTNQQAWFVDASSARSAWELLLLVAAAFGVPTGAEGEAKLNERLGHALAARGPAVFVLDNLEQVPDVAPLLHRWRELAPSARWLLTSRSVVGVEGESVVEVEPLAPGDAVELLIQRAAERGVQVRGDPTLPALAARLDGIPLALELAAGRMGLLPPRDILARLDQRFRLLRSGRRGEPDRQATLQGALDWSWDLLKSEEQAAFAQCGVFAGGFDVVAAEAVLELPAGTWALDVVDALVARSLLTVRDGRLRLFESARAYALDRLGDRRPAAEVRHGAWFARYGDLATYRLGLGGRPEPEVAARSVLGDLIVACRSAVARGDGPVAAATARAAGLVVEQDGPYELGDELAAAAMGLVDEGSADHTSLALLRARFCRLLGQNDACLAWADHVRASSREPVEVGAAWFTRSIVSMRRGQLDVSTQDLEQALRAVEGVPDTAVIRVLCFNVLARFAVERAEWDKGRALLEAAVREARSTGSPRSLALGLSNLGRWHADRGELDLARERYAGALAAYEANGETREQAILLGNLGLLECDRGRMDEAVGLLHGAVERYQRVGERYLQGTALANLGNILGDLGQEAEAEAHLGAAGAIFAEHQDLVWSAIVRGFLARVRVRQGRVAEALELVEAALPGLEGRFSLGWAAFLALRGEVRGLLDGGGLDDLRAADEAMIRGGWRRDRLGVLCAEGRHAARSGDLDRARSCLEAARNLSVEVGVHADSPMGREIRRTELVLASAG